MFIGSGKRARGSKDGEKKRGEKSRRKFEGRGAQGWAGSGGEVRGPCHESSFVAAALGSPKFQRAASRTSHWPGAWRHPHFDLSPVSRLQNPPSPGAGAPGPSPGPRPPSPSQPPAGWVSPCGLRWQRCWLGEAAGRWGKAGQSPLRSGGPPHRAPGKPEAGERRCPLLGLAATRGRRQKRVKGEKVTRTPWPRPTPPLQAAEPALPRAEPGTLSASARGAAGGPGRRNPARPRAGLRRLQS